MDKGTFVGKMHMSQCDEEPPISTPNFSPHRFRNLVRTKVWDTSTVALGVTDHY
jgi:hypothetical protein